jgi:hypothetical protein
VSHTLVCAALSWIFSFVSKFFFGGVDKCILWLSFAQQKMTEQCCWFKKPSLLFTQMMPEKISQTKNSFWPTQVFSFLLCYYAQTTVSKNEKIKCLNENWFRNYGFQHRKCYELSNFRVTVYDHMSHNADAYIYISRLHMIGDYLLQKNIPASYYIITLKAVLYNTFLSK